MIVDFQHHYVPIDLAKKKGLYSKKVIIAKDGTVPSLTIPRISSINDLSEQRDAASNLRN